MKATFMDRLLAYIIDIIIISFILAIIGAGIGNNIADTQKEMQEMDEKYLNGEITSEEYLEEYPPLYYNYQKENVLESGISVALIIVYFVVFQYMNKGQTIGKKLIKIKVVDKTTEKPISILKGFLRTFLIQSILSGIMGIVLLYLLSKQHYFIGYSIFIILEMLFILITTILVLYKKDKRGLHDIMTNTIVVKESR